MQYLRITNAGELDPRAMTLLGASDKRGDSDSIGFFGSGNKYALACLLRNNLKIHLFSGEREIKIEAKKTDFRGKSFSVIYVDGEATSITTDTGPKWQVQDAVREFWSNALDEGEAERAIIDTVHGDSSLWGRVGITSIYIEINQAINFMLNDWNKFFIPKTAEPLHINSAGSIFPASATGGVTNYYRRGVYCCDDRQTVPLFSYSFREVNLPESRLIGSYQASRKIADVLNDCTSEEVFKKMLTVVTNTPASAEWQSLEYNYGDKPFHDTFLTVMRKTGFEFIGQMEHKDRVSFADRMKTIWCPSLQFRVLTRVGMPDIMDKREYQKGYTIEGWPIGLEQVVRAEIAALATCGIDITWPVHFAEMVNEDHIALADTVDKCILISGRAFIESPDDLRKALIEEWTHLKFDVVDFSNQQQHIYLDTIVALTKKLESKHENS